jgi:hypothetical protein
MSSPGSPSLELDVRSRRLEKRVAVLGLCCATTAPWLMSQGWHAVLLAAAALGSCWVGFRHAGWWEGERRISRVSWSAEGSWLLTDSLGRHYSGALRPETRITSGLVWLRWDTRAQDAGAIRAGKQGIHSMLLTSGDIPPSQLRRLCVRLRLSRYNSSAADVDGQRRDPAI